MRAAAILLAAGRGERLGTGIPKGFVELDGRPLLAHALDGVRRCRAVQVVAVAVPSGWEGRARDLVGDGIHVVTGGDTRQRSVTAVLRVLEGAADPVEAVVCHDVARPRATAALFDAVLDALEGADGAIPVIPITDTVKRVEDGHVSETLPRDELVLVQTPQAFRWSALKESHEAAERDGFEATDDAALLERSGFRVAVVAGDPANVKVTWPEDLRLASLLGRQGV